MTVIAEMSRVCICFLNWSDFKTVSGNQKMKGSPYMQVSSGPAFMHTVHTVLPMTVLLPVTWYYMQVDMGMTVLLLVFGTTWVDMGMRGHTSDEGIRGYTSVEGIRGIQQAREVLGDTQEVRRVTGGTQQVTEVLGVHNKGKGCVGAYFLRMWSNSEFREISKHQSGPTVCLQNGRTKKTWTISRLLFCLHNLNFNLSTAFQDDGHILVGNAVIGYFWCCSFTHFGLFHSSEHHELSIYVVEFQLLFGTLCYQYWPQFYFRTASFESPEIWSRLFVNVIKWTKIADFVTIIFLPFLKNSNQITPDVVQTLSWKRQKEVGPCYPPMYIFPIAYQ